MHHVGTISFGKVENKHFHASCSCSVAGDFGDHETASGFLAMHLTRLQGINSAEFRDETVKPLEVPCSGEDTKTIPTPPVADASEKSLSNYANGTTDSSSAPSSDAKTEQSSEQSS